MKIHLAQEVGVFLLSLTAPFLLCAMNNFPAVQKSEVILPMGAVVLLSVFLLLYFTMRHKKAVDPLFYVCSSQSSLRLGWRLRDVCPFCLDARQRQCFAELSFTCMVGLTNALEQDGYIKGFMDFYLRKGEPYLSTSYAIMMSYWDGTVHFSLQLLMVRRMAQGKSFRSLGLFWAGSSIANQIVFIPGIVIGKYGSNILPAFWRNIPFLLLPIWSAVTLLCRPRELPVIPADQVAEQQKKSVLTRPVDLLLSLMLLGGMALTLLRAFVVLDCRLDVCFTYIYQYEPYLKDNVAFSKVMMLVFLFYALPLMAACVCGLGTPGSSWMLDWTLLFAGAMAQAQWCHIGGSLHSRTPFTYRIPSDAWRGVMGLNVAYAAVPILLALRCALRPAYFMPAVPKGQADKEKKQK
ncbi:transmembrane 6 superfamily member 2 [Clupea harengus]|uniref:Transmembrane 6 superfamily member 2 n=1 Tax=Clupea harengus TaxID=7950 RepID=A0A8M1K946_CLUHA|nr:transmembrane 6 superfamily member 2 [Clupea harengus]